MPRPSRVAPGGMVYHVLNRANDRRTIFHSPTDYETFYDFLLAASKRTPMRVCGYCLMPNHWHLVLWPHADGAVSEYLHWVTTRHAVHCRARENASRHGHVYQGRFKSFPVETGLYYYNVLRYVEANPIRAGLVERAEDWRWSSLYERSHGQRLIAPGPLDLPACWLEIVNARRWRTELEAIQRSARTGRPYGSDPWVDGTAASLSLEHTLRPRGRPRHDTRRQAFKMRLG